MAVFSKSQRHNTRASIMNQIIVCDASHTRSYALRREKRSHFVKGADRRASDPTTGCEWNPTDPGKESCSIAAIVRMRAKSFVRTECVRR